MSDQPYTPCPDCGRPVDPDAPGVTYAVKPVDLSVPGQTGPRDIVDGAFGFFHPDCSPARVGYNERQRPDAAS